MSSYASLAFVATRAVPDKKQGSERGDVVDDVARARRPEGPVRR
jgi:hypothetical protein